MSDTTQYIREAQEQHYRLADDGTFPNNENLPLVIYAGAIGLPAGDGASVIESVFRANGWGNSWRDGIYAYHHYHSTAHEVLGVYRGSVKVELGGPQQGVEIDARAGDVIIIPAGVVHKNLGASPDFSCVGAYPPGQSFDMNYGKEGERSRADKNIQRVPLPEADPVYGRTGPLMSRWSIR